ncbi:hypothetical protein CR513_30760, partial [Mucuna pruriens]
MRYNTWSIVSLKHIGKPLAVSEKIWMELLISTKFALSQRASNSKRDLTLRRPFFLMVKLITIHLTLTLTLTLRWDI